MRLFAEELFVFAGAAVTAAIAAVGTADALFAAFLGAVDGIYGQNSNYRQNGDQKPVDEFHFLFPPAQYRFGLDFLAGFGAQISQNGGKRQHENTASNSTADA